MYCGKPFPRFRIGSCELCGYLFICFSRLLRSLIALSTLSLRIAPTTEMFAGTLTRICFENIANFGRLPRA